MVLVPVIAVGAVGTPVNTGDASGAFNKISAVLVVILDVFDVILVSNTDSAFIALATSAVMLDEFEIILLVF